MDNKINYRWELSLGHKDVHPRYPRHLLNAFSMFGIQCPKVPVSRGNSDLFWRADWLDKHAYIKFSNATTKNLYHLWQTIGSSLLCLSRKTSFLSFAQNFSSQFFYDFRSNIFMLILMGCINQRGVVKDNQTNMSQTCHYHCTMEFLKLSQLWFYVCTCKITNEINNPNALPTLSVPKVKASAKKKTAIIYSLQNLYKLYLHFQVVQFKRKGEQPTSIFTQVKNIATALDWSNNDVKPYLNDLESWIILLIFIDITKG